MFSNRLCLRAFVFVLACMSASAAANSQVRAHGGLLFGLPFGSFNGADALNPNTNSFITSTRPHVGVQVGGYAQLPLFFQTSLQAEVYYVQKGSTIDFIQRDQMRTDRVNVTLGYLEAPLMFRMDFGKHNVRPFLMAGPAISARLSCSNKSELANAPDPSACNSNATASEGGRYTRTEFSAITALGINLHQPRYDFGVQLRANGAFTHLLKISENSADVRNRGWTVLFTVGK